MAHVDMFSLRTSRDLLAKLEHDFLRLQSAVAGQEAQFAAFDFFVCAEHMPDWLEAEGKGSAKTMRSAYPDGPLVSHIANGAKHFNLTNPAHTSLAKAAVSQGAFQSEAFDGSAFDTGGDLSIETTAGVTESVGAVAFRVLEHWRKAV
jgi:hypothetical protein